MNLQSNVQRLVDNFVAQVGELARRAAIDTLAGAFGNAARGRGRILNGTRGTKRRSENHVQLSEMIVSFVTKNPGLRVEQINKQLGTTTKALQLPIRKLLASGALKSKGNRRATAYFPGK